MSKRTANWPPSLLRPDNDAGKQEAEAEFRAMFGRRYAGVYIDGHMKSDPTQVFYKPRLIAANFA